MNYQTELKEINKEIETTQRGCEMSLWEVQKHWSFKSVDDTLKYIERNPQDEYAKIYLNQITFKINLLSKKAQLIKDAKMTEDIANDIIEKMEGVMESAKEDKLDREYHEAWATKFYMEGLKEQLGLPLKEDLK